MTAPLPSPLLPLDVDLQGMAYMPVYIERLRRSRAMALARSEKAAGFVMRLLWEESWWSLPAGSLENDDLTLAAAGHCSRAEWRQLKEVALYGWVLCSDGRYYHPVICQIAWETWQERLKARHRMECDRISKANKREIADATKSKRQAVTVNHPSYEAYVRKEFPATAARLFPDAASQCDPAPVNGPAVSVLSEGQAGGVGRKPPDVGRTQGGSPADNALKPEGKYKNLPPYPPLGGAAASPAETAETGKEGQREADFAAFMRAVDQPDAPLRTCWQAWLEVLPTLPPQRMLLAQVAAWRHHCAQLGNGNPRYRPMAPQRLLREGTLNAFADKAEAMLANEAATVMIDLAEAEKAKRAKASWGDLYDPLVGVVKREAVFLGWFADGWPEWEGEKLIICTTRLACREWINTHFRRSISDALGREVEVRQVFKERDAA